MTSEDGDQRAGTERGQSNPYAGPRALQQGEPIHGREREINELRGLILSERIVLLYSRSGAGKTSLIEAGLRPEFERRRFHVMPTIRVGYETPSGTPKTNRYSLSVLTSLETAKPAEEQLAPESLASISLKDYFQDVLDADADLDLFLVFDQFEEIFTLDPTDWNDKETFLHELGSAMANRSIFALFSMREDFIAQLDPYESSMPTRFSNTYRLELLGPSDARSAIQKPAEAAGVEFADDAANGLIEDLRSVRVDRGGVSTMEPGPRIEPVQLQVVCSQLWEHLNPGTTKIQPEDLDDIGNVDEALAGYYSSAVARIAGSTHVKEKDIREWFEEKLISEDGYRTPTRDGPEGGNAKVLTELESAHLIRADRRFGTQWYELTHDRFVTPIEMSNRAFHRGRRSRLAKILIPVGVLIVLMALASIAVDRFSASPTAVSEAPAVDLNSVPNPDVSTVPASEVKRYRFDDGVRGNEITLIVTAVAPESSLGVKPVVDVRLLQVGTADTEGTLAIGETKAVIPDESNLGDMSEAGMSSTTIALPSSDRIPSSQETFRRVELKYSLPANGSYFIEITSSTGGTVELSHETEAGAQKSELRFDEPLDGRLDTVVPVGRFDFTVEDKEVVEIVLGSFDPLDGVLNLFDEAGALLESVDVTGVGGRETMVTALPTSGTYSVSVSGYEGSAGAYSLVLERPEIISIAAGSSVDGNFSTGGFANVYSFSAEQGEAVIVTLIHDEDAVPTLVVMGEGARQVGIAGLVEYSLEGAQVWAGGDGLIVVTDDEGSQTEFTLSFERVASTAIEIGELFTGQGQSGEPQYLHFNGSPGEMYSVELSGPGTISAIFAPGNVFIPSEVFVAPFEGDYLIALGPDVSSDFSVVVTRPVLEEISYGETAVPVVVDEEGSLWYVFDAAAGDTYSIRLETDGTEIPGWLMVNAPDGFLEVFDSGGTDVDALFAGGVAPIDGTYLITAIPFQAGAYTISLDR